MSNLVEDKPNNIYGAFTTIYVTINNRQIIWKGKRDERELSYTREPTYDTGLTSATTSQEGHLLHQTVLSTPQLLGEVT